MDAEEARRCRYLEDLCNGLGKVRKPLLAAVEGMAVRLSISNHMPILLGYVSFKRLSNSV
jgi:hypothetical protein